MPQLNFVALSPKDLESYASALIESADLINAVAAAMRSEKIDKMEFANVKIMNSSVEWSDKFAQAAKEAYANSFRESQLREIEKLQKSAPKKRK